jgi:hypothetical protein
MKNIDFFFIVKVTEDFASIPQPHPNLGLHPRIRGPGSAIPIRTKMSPIQNTA